MVNICPCYHGLELPPATFRGEILLCRGLLTIVICAIPNDQYICPVTHVTKPECAFKSQKHLAFLYYILNVDALGIFVLKPPQRGGIPQIYKKAQRQY